MNSVKRFLYGISNYIIYDKYKCILDHSELIFDIYNSIYDELYNWSVGTLQESENENDMFKCILDYTRLTDISIYELMKQIYIIEEMTLEEEMSNLNLKKNN
jgi:hypothetical protein